MMDSLNINLEAQINITACLPSTNAPVFFRDFPQQNFYMILGDAERLKIGHDCPVKIAALGIQ